MLNYFTLFAMPICFDLDLKRLSTNYRALQKITHPDKFAGQSEQQQLIAMQKNSQVNDGFNVLKSPISRAEHLLALRGIELANETQTMQDTTFLMQQMQWRESLEESSQLSDPQAAIDALIDQVNNEQNTINTEMRGLFEQNSDAANQQAAEAVRKLKFIDKMHNEVSELEDKLFN
jgi:molecular chaperone HscB